MVVAAPVGVSLLVAGMLPAANAAGAQINPFDVNGGFTVLVQGDATLGNNELEGSIAVTGRIVSTKQNFPLVHKVAGLDDYTIPSIDGVPVRLLAGSFASGSEWENGLAVTNAGAPAGSNEAKGIAKLVDTDGLQASSRGSNWTRVTTGPAILDLAALPFVDQASALAAIKTQASSVSDYLPDLDSRIATVNECLATYDKSNDDVAFPIIDGITLTGFATDRPNVMSYTDLVGKSIDPGSYEPTAAAPLIVQVPAGTTRLDKLDFRGWDSNAGADQAFARYILHDLSRVTGDVTIDGLEMGAVWSPDVNLTFNSNITTNGQWISRNFASGPGAGELHHHTFSAQLPCATVVPEPSATPSPEPSEEPSVEPSVTPSPEPSEDPTEEPSVTPSPEPSEEPSETPTPQPTRTPEATSTPSVPATATPTPTASPSTARPGLPSSGAGGAGAEALSAVAVLLAAGLVGGIGVRRRG